MTALSSNFALVPYEALVDRELTPAEFKMLAVLYSFRNKHADTVWPKIESIQERAGYSDTTQVSRMTTKLERKGWLNKCKKNGPRGSKRYQLTIPERLIAAPYCQLDRESQPDNSEQQTTAPKRQADNSQRQTGALKSQLDPDCQLDHLRQRQLDPHGQRQLDRHSQLPGEHTSEHIKEHSVPACADTAAGAAQAVDNSLEDISLSALMDLVNSDQGPKALFDVGVKYLGARGVGEISARGLVAKLIAEYGEGLVFDAFQTMIEATPTDPKAYLFATLQGRMKPIPSDWTPPETIVAKFTGMGVPADVIRKERDALVEHHRLTETRHHDWDDLFERRMTRHYERAEGNPGVMRSVVARAAGFDPKPFVEPTSL